MFNYRAITANCGNETLGKKACTRITELFKAKATSEALLDFCVINCQEVHFEKAKKELQQALTDAGLGDYVITQTAKMRTPTKSDSLDDIKNALQRSTGMASFIVHRKDITIDLGSSQAARRNPGKKMGPAFNKGGLVSDCKVKNATGETIDLQLVSGHLDSNKMKERAMDWGVIQKALAPSSKKITNFDALSRAVPNLRLSGYDANTRNRLVDNKVENLWNKDDAFELEGLKQVVLGGGRFSADSTYKTEDKRSAMDPSPVKKRAGYTKGGMLDFVDVLDGTEAQGITTEDVMIIDSDDPSTARDHAVVISPEQSYKVPAAFEKTRDQMAVMLAQAAPDLASDLRELGESEESKQTLVNVYSHFLSKEGLLHQEFSLFKDKLGIIQRVNKKNPEHASKLQSRFFSRVESKPWFNSINLSNFKEQVNHIEKTQAQEKETITHEMKAVKKAYPSKMSAMKQKFQDTMRDLVKDKHVSFGSIRKKTTPSSDDVSAREGLLSELNELEFSNDEQLDSDTSSVTSLFEGEPRDLKQVSECYTQKFSEEVWKKEPEINVEGHLAASFPDEKTVMDFSQEIAAKNHLAFIAVDEDTGKVIAYSYGDGELHKNTENKSAEEIRAEFGGEQNTPT